MDFIIDTKEMSEQDKARSPEQSQEISADRSDDNDRTDAT